MFSFTFLFNNFQKTLDTMHLMCNNTVESIYHPTGATPRKGARAMMTPKERIKVHAEIERENARKLREWKEQQKKEGAA